MSNPRRTAEGTTAVEVLASEVAMLRRRLDAAERRQAGRQRPRGVLARVTFTTDTAVVNGATIGSTDTITIPVGGDRLIRVTGSGRVTPADAGAFWRGGLMEGASTPGTQVGAWHEKRSASASDEQMRSEGSVMLVRGPGSYRYHLRLERFGGSGGADYEVAADRPGMLLVEDLGPA